MDVYSSKFHDLRTDGLSSQISMLISQLNRPEFHDHARISYGTFVTYMPNLERWHEFSELIRDLQHKHPMRLVFISSAGEYDFPDKPQVRVSCGISQNAPAYCTEEILLPLEPDNDAIANDIFALADSDLPLYFLPLAPVGKELIERLKEYGVVFVLPNPDVLPDHSCDILRGILSNLSEADRLCDLRWPRVLYAIRTLYSTMPESTFRASLDIEYSNNSASLHTSLLIAGSVVHNQSLGRSVQVIPLERGVLCLGDDGIGTSVTPSNDLNGCSGKLTSFAGDSAFWEPQLDHIHMVINGEERVNPVLNVMGISEELAHLLPMPDMYVPSKLVELLAESHRAETGKQHALVFESREVTAKACAMDFRASMRLAVQKRGRAFVALSGGTTPAALYKAIRELDNSGIPWSDLKFFFVDERAVPPESERSNYKLANDGLFEHFNVPASNIFRITGEKRNIDEEAKRYETLIGNEIAETISGIPVFDYILLGLGADGHTASLFPLTSELDELTRLVVPSKSPDGENRITMTFPLINAARRVVFLATGSSKSSQVVKLLDWKTGQTEIPAKRVKPRGFTMVYLDEDAYANGQA